MPVGFLINNHPPNGIYITGVKLVNAGWDSSKKELRELLPGEDSSSELPPIWIKPIQKSSQDICTANAYNCPLFSTSSSYFLNEDSFLIFIPLTSSLSSSVWAQKRVALIRS